MSDKIPPLCDQPKWNHIRHRCCCVFDHDSDKNEPLAECYYHERIRARLAEAERDADRYRWLREENHAFDWDGFPWPKGFTWDDDVDMCVNLDRAIDIARAADSAPAAPERRACTCLYPTPAKYVPDFCGMCHGRITSTADEVKP